ncbi:MAG: CHRD domain-containing protein [Acidobacteria bacterium]|nr:CHRD domain-containing protein [Acidobacteriota bacterium]
MKRSTVKYCSTFAAMVLLFSAVALMADTTETRFFNGNLSPANEVPAVTGVTASGQAIITAVIRRDGGGNIVSGTVYFDIDYNIGQAVTVTGLHIHEGGAVVNGPIRIDTGISGNATVSAQGQGNIFRVVEVTSGGPLTALIGMVANPGGFYVNLHTTVNPGGLMRDQLQAAAQPAPAVFENGVVNNASFASGTNPLAPGSIAAVFGKYLNDGPAAVFTSFGADGKLITSLGGTQVKVNEIAAPIFYSTFTQVGIQIPEELTGQTSATIQVIVGGKTSISRTVSLDAAVPGIFTLNQAGSGAAAMLHQDGVTPVTAANPAQPNEVIILFGTGLGATNPALATGAASTGNRVTNTPTVTVDGVALVPDFAGRAPNFVGLDQLNVKVPANVRASSDLSVIVTSGARQSNTVTTSATNASGPPSNPVPAVTSLTPNYAYVRDPAMTVTINGSGFIPASTVLVDNAPRDSTYVSDTQLTIQITAGETSAERSLAVRVQNPAPGGGDSNSATFSVLPAPPPPDPYDY